jgi:hypothetical protein
MGAMTKEPKCQTIDSLVFVYRSELAKEVAVVAVVALEQV